MPSGPEKVLREEYQPFTDVESLLLRGGNFSSKSAHPVGVLSPPRRNSFPSGLRPLKRNWSGETCQPCVLKIPSDCRKS
jgi:hypothetical protein